MYYTAVDFVADAEIPHLVMQHGWLYYAYAITTVVELIACIFILVVSILKTNQEHMRYNYGILLLVVLIPFLGYIFTIVGILSGMFSVLSMLYGYSDPKAKEEKMELYKRVQKSLAAKREDDEE